jgi:hypothetical protein
MTSAVINEASVEAKKDVVLAMSSGVVNRFKGVTLMDDSAMSSKLAASRPSNVKAEGSKPGAMALTVTLCGANSLAMERVSPTKPALHAT